MTTPGHDSFIPKVFGMHRVRNSQHHDPVYIMVMKNIFWGPHRPHVRYEIKGSQRKAPDSEKSGVVKLLKDDDFSADENMIFLRPAQKELILSELKRDTDLLTSVNAMDYALNIGVHFESRKDPPARTLREYYGLRDRDEEVMAFNEDTSLSDEAAATQAKLQQGVYPFLPKQEDDEIATISNFTIDHGGMFTAAWDKRRKCYKAQDLLIYLGLTGCFQPFSFKKSFEAWWKRSDHGRSCLPPPEFADRLNKRVDGMFNFESENFTQKQHQQSAAKAKAKATATSAAAAAAGPAPDESKDAVSKSEKPAK